MEPGNKVEAGASFHILVKDERETRATSDEAPSFACRERETSGNEAEVEVPHRRDRRENRQVCPHRLRFSLAMKFTAIGV